MIPLFKVRMTPKAIYASSGVLQSGYISQGAKAEEFEKKVQSVLHNPYVALTDTCTSAITLALRMSDVGPGSEVISSPLTCLASNEPILNLGGTPVWCDIDAESLNIDTFKIEELITEKTKAVIYVHYSGVPVCLDKIKVLKVKYPHIKFIADCAHAWMAYYWFLGDNHYSQIGSDEDIADFSCFSMGPIKHFNSIEGGALACKRKEDYERAKLLRWYGHDRNGPKTEVRWSAEVYEHGYKFNLNDVNASVGLENIQDLGQVVDMYRDNAEYYEDNIENDLIQKLNVDPSCSPSWWIYNLLLPNEEERLRFVKLMKRHRIETSIVHTRNDSYKAFEPFKRNLPVLDKICNQYIAIPVGAHVSEDDRKYIVEVINEEF